MPSASLIDWHSVRTAIVAEDIVEPWLPRALVHDEWPPNYRAVYSWRIRQLALMRSDPAILKSAKAYYSTRPAEFIMHWLDTYDPRKEHSKWIPFIFFKRQLEFIEFLHACRLDGESGLTEKCRDAGATWCACAYSIWSFLFIENDAIGWGSRKEDLVDKLGDPSSIFEKMRQLLRRLPAEFMPQGFDYKKHATFMKFVNPENGAVITGETGDNIGRGGRTSMYFKDESAHYERPLKIEAALGDTTRVQIDISSVNGVGNPFHRRREAGIVWPLKKSGYVRVFIIDWRDHPEKTQEWYDMRKARNEREGMLHIFAQEVDRNYSASQQNTLIPHEWIVAAVDAHLKVPYLAKIVPPNVFSAGLDVADEGLDRNAAALRQWIILRDVEEWGERDVGVTTRKTIAKVGRFKGIAVQYDCIGVGAGVKSEFNRLVADKLVAPDLCRLVPWNAGAAVINPYERLIPGDEGSPFNRDFFGNFKAQAWWSVRTRFYKTFKAVTEGAVYQPDELISLDGKLTLLHQVIKELAQPTSGQGSSLRTIVQKKPDGTKSPNCADAIVMAFYPAPDNTGQAYVGKYG